MKTKHLSIFIFFFTLFFVSNVHSQDSTAYEFKVQAVPFLKLNSHFYFNQKNNFTLGPNVVLIAGRQFAKDGRFFQFHKITIDAYAGVGWIYFARTQERKFGFEYGINFTTPIKYGTGPYFGIRNTSKFTTIGGQEPIYEMGVSVLGTLNLFYFQNFGRKSNEEKLHGISFNVNLAALIAFLIHAEFNP